MASSSSSPGNKPPRPFTVAIEGNIGCGKTTFLSHYQSNPNVFVLAEPVDKWRDVEGHNLLDMMYSDPARWSMVFQSYVQLTMLQNHSAVCQEPIKMMERSLFSARFCFIENLFRSGTMSSAECAVLQQWFNFITGTLKVAEVDLIVYLRTDPKVVHNRIQQRKRPEESGVPLEYLQSLHQLHEDWLINKTIVPLQAPVVTIDANQDLSELKEAYSRYQDIIMNKYDETVLTKQSIVV